MNFQRIKEFIVDKYCCKYKIPYYALMLLWAKGLHKQYKGYNSSIINYEQIIKDFLKENSNSDMYIFLKGAAGDISLYGFLVDSILQYTNRNYKIFILGSKKYLDILSLYKMKYNFVKIVGLDDKNLLLSEKEISNVLNISGKIGFLDLRGIIENNQKIFYSNHNKYNYKSFESLGQGISISNNIKDSRHQYTYRAIDLKKIKSILSYSNQGMLYLCNFENKSYKLARKDSIKFSDYINKISKIAKEQNLKFVINSVYNNEKLYNDENILITRLNFQEIIRLAEHKKIKLFISERNGLNDVFKVFWPDINQIIYYPDYYNPICDKKIYYMLYKETLQNADVKDFWHLPGDNIYEDIRQNFFSTVEKQILKVVK